MFGFIKAQVSFLLVLVIVAETMLLAGSAAWKEQDPLITGMAKMAGIAPPITSDGTPTVYDKAKGVHNPLALQALARDEAVRMVQTGDTTEFRQQMDSHPAIQTVFGE